MSLASSTWSSFKDDDGVVELLGFFEPCTHACDAVVHAQNRAPVAVDHVLEVLDGFGTIIGEVFAPLEQRAVDAMLGVEALFEPCGLVIELEGGGGVGDAHVIKAVRILRASGRRSS